MSRSQWKARGNMQTYTTKDMMDVSGIKQQQMHRMVDGGCLTPSIRKATGSGDRNIWSYWDLVRGCIVAKLHILPHEFLVRLMEKLTDSVLCQGRDGGVAVVLPEFEFSVGSRLRVVPEPKLQGVFPDDDMQILISINAIDRRVTERLG